MSIVINTVNPEHLVDAGRTIFNNNDTSIADGVTSLTNQLTTHEAAGHPDLYYTKTEADEKIATRNAEIKRHTYHFAILADGETVQVNGQSISAIPMHTAGSVVRVTIQNQNGFYLSVTAAFGTYPFDANQILTLITGFEFPGDEVIPSLWGIAVNTVGEQFNVYTSPNPPGGAWGIDVEVEYL